MELPNLGENLILDHEIQGRGGLVRDDKAGIEHQGHGDDDPLPHASAELMGVVAVPSRVQPHELEQVARLAQSLL